MDYWRKEQATKGALEIVTSVINNEIPLKDSLKHKSVYEIFAVLDLVKKDNIPELLLDVERYLAAFPLSDDIVLDVAFDAMQYSSFSQFQNEAKDLLLLCASFLKPKFKYGRSVFQFVADNEIQGEVLLKLMSLMKDIPCANCLGMGPGGKNPKSGHVEEIDECGIPEDQFRVGQLVFLDGDSEYGNYYGYGKGIVTKVEEAGVYLKDADEHVHHDHAFNQSNNQIYPKIYNGRPTFGFACDYIVHPHYEDGSHYTPSFLSTGSAL